jgi:hypothetical protein
VIAQLTAFVGVAALVIVTPGPDTALTIRNSLLSGRRARVFSSPARCQNQRRQWRRTLPARAGRSPTAPEPDSPRMTS